MHSRNARSNIYDFSRASKIPDCRTVARQSVAAVAVIALMSAALFAGQRRSSMIHVARGRAAEAHSLQALVAIRRTEKRRTMRRMDVAAVSTPYIRALFVATTSLTTASRFFADRPCRVAAIVVIFNASRPSNCDGDI